MMRKTAHLLEEMNDRISALSIKLDATERALADIHTRINFLKDQINDTEERAEHNTADIHKILANIKNFSDN